MSQPKSAAKSEVHLCLVGDDANTYVDEKRAAQMASLSPSWFRRARSKGIEFPKAPRYVRLGGAIRYRIGDLLEWLTANRH